jgi:hypothetical protein
MDHLSADALAIFGATGDLAYKKIFPSLQAMVKRGNLNVPVIGVAIARLGPCYLICERCPEGQAVGMTTASFQAHSLRKRSCINRSSLDVVASKDNLRGAFDSAMNGLMFMLWFADHQGISERA